MTTCVARKCGFICLMVRRGIGGALNLHISMMQRHRCVFFSAESVG
ncbi:MAG: hypothetical protein ACPGRG_02415 [Marinomonas sp.]